MIKIPMLGNCFLALLICSFGNLAEAKAADGQSFSGSCTSVEATQRALSLMQYYMNHQRISAQDTLSTISQETDSLGLQRLVKKMQHRLNRLSRFATRRLDNLPTDVLYCSDLSCYNVSLRDKINAFRLSVSLIRDLQIQAGELGEAALGLSAAAIGEEAHLNFNILMDATDSYPLMTMVCR